MRDLNLEPCEDKLDNEHVVRSVIVPTVECEDVTGKRCVKIPSVEESDTEAQACVPVVANPKCDKVGREMKRRSTTNNFLYERGMLGNFPN